ncbi:hypothetical protein [Mycobacterium simiae]|uniref:hypothetical protein n=1 Tax=Mycobacterium simiae TaxID=1784 RepID=UPI00263466D8|nr:hypothetical protein [Mycobacterium simiae]
MVAPITDLATFIRQRRAHADAAAGAEGSLVEFGALRMHFETTDHWPSLSGCREWRGCVRVSALDADRGAADVDVAVVQFLILRAGHESLAEVLPRFGSRAATFVELFDDQWLDPELDESEDFTAGMPISTVLIVLDAAADSSLPPNSRLRAWAVAETVHTMLPTTTGLVLMPALPAATAPRHKLIPTDQIDPDWTRIGCTSVPGHPRFYGQATAYVYLDEARDALADVRDEPIRIYLPI